MNASRFCLAICGVLVAVHLTDGLDMRAEYGCDKFKRAKVSKYWDIYYNVVTKTEISRTNICISIFRALFKMDNATEQLFAKYNFKERNSPEFKAFCARVMGAGDTMFSTQGDRQDYEIAEAQIEHVANFHSKIPGFRKVYVDMFALAWSTIQAAVIQDYDETLLVNGVPDWPIECGQAIFGTIRKHASE